MLNVPVTELGLCEFALANRGSTRLRNSLEAARNDNRLPFRTVGDYLAASAPVQVLCAEVRSLGRRTALELDRMVREIVSIDGKRPSWDAPEVTALEAALAEARATLATLPLRSLMDGVPSHGRLVRILEAPLGELPVLAAIDDPNAVREEALRIPGVGTQKVADLIAEVRLWVSRFFRDAGYSPETHDALMAAIYGGHGGPAWCEKGGVDDAARRTRELIFDCVRDVPCGSEFAFEFASVRLTRLLRISEIGNTSLADALLDRGSVTAKLLRFPNTGRKTVMEFWEICWRRLAVALACRGIPIGDLDALAAALRVERPLLDPRPGDLTGSEATLAGAGEPVEAVVTPADLNGLLEFALERIRPQDAVVVRRRFGLDGGRGETLEEVGASVGITRERIRQIESRGLRQLRTQCRRVDLGAALDADWANAWQALACGDDLVTDPEFETFRRMVPGGIKLALELLGLELAAWLSRISHRYPHGWLAPTRDVKPVDKVIAALDILPNMRPLPRAVRELDLPGSDIDVEAALLIGRGHRVLHGYLVEGRIGTRRRRSLVAHAVLSRARGPMLLTDLLRACHEAAPADWCTLRDLTIVMSDVPHLFLEVSEGCWFALGAGGEIPAGGRREVDVADEASAEQDPTVASAIRDEIERTGPQPLAALTENPWRYLPRERSRNSIQPTLFTRPDLFARLLPGVYGLWAQVPTREEVLTGDLPYLFDETQARIFSMARRAGEPWGVFPLWSPEAEYRLCRWAMRDASSAVRRSLLSTATVEIWPIEADERSHWLDLKAREGRYDLLETLRPGIFTVRPDLDRLLAALISVEASGQTSWMALNRIDGRHVASQLGCALLATLLLCGALIPPDDAEESAWQLVHGVRRSVVRELRHALSAELHGRGELIWSSAAGRLVAARILEGCDRAPGWLPYRRFSEQFRGLEPDPVTRVEITIETAGEVGRALLAERRMADLLEWLDAQ